MHAGTANVPCRVFLTVSDEECLLCGCNLQCRLGIDQLDANATWADKLRLGRVGKYRTIARQLDTDAVLRRSEEHTSELQSLMRISYAVFCLKKKKKNTYKKMKHNT